MPKTSTFSRDSPAEKNKQNIMPTRKIDISEETYQLLQKFAIPLEDTPDTIIRKLAEQASRAIAGQALMPAKPKLIQNGQARPSRTPWKEVNFRLPNNDISVIWGISRQAVATRRSTHKLGSAAWHYNPRPTGDYLAVIQDERVKAAKLSLRLSPPTPTNEPTEEMMGT
jgi:hypothetical protein